MVFGYQDEMLKLAKMLRPSQFYTDVCGILAGVCGHVTSGVLFFFFEKKFLADTCPFLGPLVPLFWISGDVSSGFQSQSGFCLINFFAEANVMYTFRDSSLVLHVLTSWSPAAQPVTSPHASAEPLEYFCPLQNHFIY